MAVKRKRPSVKRKSTAVKRRRPAVKRKRTMAVKRRRKNPLVYDNAGKLVGNFKRKSAKFAARVVGGTVGKPKPKANPIPRGKALAFRTKAAAKKYARLHPVKGRRYSIKKVGR